jgi:integrase
VIYRYLVAVFHAAVADKVIVTTPCTGIKLPKVEPRRIEPPTTEMVAAMRDGIATRYRALIMLCAGTGLRQGEAFAVELEHVDWLRRSLRVCQQLVLMPGAEPVIGPLKTVSSYRTVPLPQVVLDALAEHVAEFAPAGFEMLDLTGPRPVRRIARLLFVRNDGGPLRRTSFSRRDWVKARERAGLPATFTSHDLRHYYASLLIRHGESVKVVQSRLGHATAAETLDTYSHLWPDSEDRTRQAVDDVLRSGGAADSVRTEGAS